MIPRMWLLAIGAWIGVVVVGSTLTWLAIDHAGQQVTSSAVFSELTPSPARPTPSEHAPSVKPRPKPRHTTPPSHAPQTSVPTPVTTPSATPPATPRTQVGTWSGAAGSVTVSCTSSVVRFVGAAPNTGWQVSGPDVSGSSLEMTFSRSGAQVQVQATCAGGAPAFQADSGSAPTDG